MAFHYAGIMHGRNLFYATGLLSLFLCTRSPLFCVFLLFAPCQYTPLPNLNPVIFGLTPLG